MLPLCHSFKTGNKKRSLDGLRRSLYDLKTKGEAMSEKTDTLIEDLKTALANSEANLKFWFERAKLHENRAADMSKKIVKLSAEIESCTCGPWNKESQAMIDQLMADSEKNVQFWIDRSELHERRADVLMTWIREKHFEEREKKIIWSERTAPPPDVFAMPDADQQ
jgi:hypothetical protein